MEFIDTHNHLDFQVFDADREQILQAAATRRIRHMILAGVTPAGWPAQQALVRAYPQQLSWAIGLHPEFLDPRTTEAALQSMQRYLHDLSATDAPCAIGEIGLDYQNPAADRAAQQACLIRQLALAEQHQLPILLHVRKAHADTQRLLRRFPGIRRGIVHAFSGSWEEARIYLQRGLKLGLGGAGTWPGARRMHRVLQQLPLDGIVLETDAPDMPPSSHPGQRNSPLNLPEICRTLANYKGVSAETLAAHCHANTLAVFGWETAEPVS